MKVDGSPAFIALVGVAVVVPLDVAAAAVAGLGGPALVAVGVGVGHEGLDQSVKGIPRGRLSHVG